ncbi:MAG: exodeoxyribonuclease VII small subunit [Deltaproteobacteria bacterium]|nr:exodeoxyribonuclease VII small subunit [Deltaproteobacteria bacterium]
MAESKKNAIRGFEENYKKLEKLAQELQENNISIDDLVPRMKEAVESIKICKEILKETKAQLTEVSSEFSELNEA